MCKNLWIRGKKWRVVIKPSLRCDLGVEVDGLCDTTARVIYLDTSLSGEHLKQRFFHEYFHAVLGEYGFEVTGIPEILEDMLVNTLATELVESFCVKQKK